MSAIFWFEDFYFNTFNLFALFKFFIFFFCLRRSLTRSPARPFSCSFAVNVTSSYFFLLLLCANVLLARIRLAKIKIKINTVGMKIINKRHALLRPRRSILFDPFSVSCLFFFSFVCSLCDLFGTFFFK